MQMATTEKVWTLDELNSLPDDGNKYELVRGDLFVTPAPTVGHEVVLAHLSRLLDPYVAANNLGLVLHPRSALRFQGSEVEPDLMVRRREAPEQDWETMPPPSLLVEVLSPSTRRRDREHKRAFYLEAGVAEYWIIDPDARSITVVRPGAPDVVASDVMRWHPSGASVPLDVAVRELFAL